MYDKKHFLAHAFPALYLRDDEGPCLKSILLITFYASLTYYFPNTQRDSGGYMKGYLS